MTTPHQTAGQAFGTAVGGQWGDVASFVGQGAYQVGSAAQNWGQDVTQAFVKALINGPAAALGAAFTSVEHFLEELGTWLATLPLEALQMFQAFIPGSVLADFATVASAVETIINALGLGNVLMYLGDFEAWLSATFSIVEANALAAVTQLEALISGVAGTTITDVVALLNKIQQILDAVANALGHAGSGFTVSQVQSILGAIPTTNVTGMFGPTDLESTLQAFADGVHQGLIQGETSVVTSVEVIRNGLNQLTSYLGWDPHLSAPAVGSVSGIATSSAQSLLDRAITKPSYMGVDPSTDAVFHLTQVPTVSGAPTTISVTASTSAIGFIGTPDGGLKKSVAWIGKDTTGITGLYINVYKVDTASGALTLLYSSPNYIGFVNNTLSWNFFDFPDPDDIDSKQGDWYAVELQVTGSGTYKVVGMSHWLGNLTHPTVYPAHLAATRTAGSPPATIPSPTYTTEIPWFALCGTTAQTEHIRPPETVQYYSPGSFTYTVPSWVRAGDFFDIVLVGGGGGGAGGGTGAPGDGGNAGGWAYATLTYGIHIPVGTTTFSGYVGYGGGGGGYEAYGSGGQATTVTITGFGTISGGGGSTNNGFGSAYGRSPGDITFDTKPYHGGAVQGNEGWGGNVPGGGGAGGTGFGENFFFGFASGGGGASGAAWITAYQGAHIASGGSVVRPRIMRSTAAMPTPALRSRVAATLTAAASVPTPVVRERLGAAVGTAAASLSAPTLRERVTVTLTDAAAFAVPVLRFRVAAPTLTAAAAITTPSVVFHPLGTSINVAVQASTR